MSRPLLFLTNPLVVVSWTVSHCNGCAALPIKDFLRPDQVVALVVRTQEIDLAVPAHLLGKQSVVESRHSGECLHCRGPETEIDFIK